MPSTTQFLLQCTQTRLQHLLSPTRRQLQWWNTGHRDSRSCDRGCPSTADQRAAPHEHYLPNVMEKRVVPVVPPFVQHITDAPVLHVARVAGDSVVWRMGSHWNASGREQEFFGVTLRFSKNSSRKLRFFATAHEAVWEGRGGVAAVSSTATGNSSSACCCSMRSGTAWERLPKQRPSFCCESVTRLLSM